MHITIIQISKTKHHYFDEAIQEYLKRLQKFAKVDVITLKESSKPDIKTAKQEESQAILQAVPKGTFKILLDQSGQQFTSEECAEKLQMLANYGQSHLCIIIGGPYGTTPDIKSASDLVLSLSKCTFTHEMVRVFLLEQLYRAFTIINNQKYHH